MIEAKRKLSGFDFSDETSHVALVSKDQAGAANGYKTLLTKAADVSVELSLAEFLYRFTDMWYSEATMVARMLGYSDTMDAAWDEEELEKRVTIMKSAKETGKITPKLIETVTVLSKALNVSIKDADGGGTPSDPVSDVEKASNEVTPDEGDNKMSDTQVDVQAEIQKALEAQKAEVEKAVKAQYEEIEKGLKEEIEAFKAKEVEVQKAQFVEVAKGYQALGVEEEAVDGFAVALMKMKGDETFEPVMKALEKGLNIAKAAAEGTFEVQGHDVDNSADLSPDEQLAQMIKKANESK